MVFYKYRIKKVNNNRFMDGMGNTHEKLLNKTNKKKEIIFENS